MALRILISGIYGFIVLIFVLIACLFLIPFRGMRIRVGNIFAKVVCFPMVRILGVGHRVVGSEFLGAQRAIYVANHSSSLDFFLGSALAPMGTSGVAKKEIVRIPVAGQVFWLAGHMIIDRGNPQKAKESLNALGQLSEKLDISIWLWPEGTRSRTGRLLPFKRGFVHMACATGLPVVPIVLVGVNKCWPAKGWRITPGEIEVRVMPPIDTSSSSPDNAKAHAESVHEIFAQCLPAEQQPEA